MLDVFDPPTSIIITVTAAVMRVKPPNIAAAPISAYVPLLECDTTISARNPKGRGATALYAVLPPVVHVDSRRGIFPLLAAPVIL